MRQLGSKLQQPISARCMQTLLRLRMGCDGLATWYAALGFLFCNGTVRTVTCIHLGMSAMLSWSAVLCNAYRKTFLACLGLQKSPCKVSCCRTLRNLGLSSCSALLGLLQLRAMLGHLISPRRLEQMQSSFSSLIMAVPHCFRVDVKRKIPVSHAMAGVSRNGRCTQRADFGQQRMCIRRPPGSFAGLACT